MEISACLSGAYVIESAGKDILLEHCVYGIDQLLTFFFAGATAIPIAVTQRLSAFVFDYFLPLSPLWTIDAQFSFGTSLMYIGYVKFGWSLGGMFRASS